MDDWSPNTGMAPAGSEMPGFHQTDGYWGFCSSLPGCICGQRDGEGDCGMISEVIFYWFLLEKSCEDVSGAEGSHGAALRDRF